jgi:hypothetical protein
MTPRKLHVIFYTFYFPPEIGAPQSRLSYNAEYLVSQGHRVTVLTTMPNYPHGIVRPGYRGRWFHREEWRGCDVLRAWAHTSPNRNFLNRLASFVTFNAASNLLTLPRMDRPDAILVESPPLLNGASAALWRRLKGAALVMHISDLEIHALLEFKMLPGPAAPLLKGFQRTILSQADAVVTVSDYCKEDLVAGGAPPDRTAVIPNGVDVDLFTPAADPRPWRERLGLPQDVRLAIYAGTHGHMHGVEQIVEAAHLLRDEPIFILMVGDGVGKAGALRRAQEYGLRNIRFLCAQPLEILADYLKAADIGLSTLTSRETNHSVIPVKMLTYMACGLPTVSSDRHHCRQILEESRGAGVLVPPDDSRALAEAIRLLAGDAAARREMGARGREYVLRGWSRKTQAARLLDVLYEACKRRGRA